MRGVGTRRVLQGAADEASWLAWESLHNDVGFRCSWGKDGPVRRRTVRGRSVAATRSCRERQPEPPRMKPSTDAEYVSQFLDAMGPSTADVDPDSAFVFRYGRSKRTESSQAGRAPGADKFARK